MYVTTYTTPDGLNTEQIENAAGTKAGAYYTICTISGYAENEFFVKNYEVGAWPSDVVKNILDWEIATKVIKTPKPTAETNWDTFDGKLHNLINVFNIDVDWEEYFTIAMTYTDTSATPVTGVYDGTKAYEIGRASCRERV